MQKASHVTYCIIWEVAQGCRANRRVTVTQRVSGGGFRCKGRESIQEQRRVLANCTEIGESREVWFLKLRKIRNSTEVHWQKTDWIHHYTESHWSSLKTQPFKRLYEPIQTHFTEQCGIPVSFLWEKLTISHRPFYMPKTKAQTKNEKTERPGVKTSLTILDNHSMLTLCVFEKIKTIKSVPYNRPPTEANKPLLFQMRF